MPFPSVYDGLGGFVFLPLGLLARHKAKTFRVASWFWHALVQLLVVTGIVAVNVFAILEGFGEVPMCLLVVEEVLPQSFRQGIVL